MFLKAFQIPGCGSARLVNGMGEEVLPHGLVERLSASVGGLTLSRLHG